MLPTSKLSRTGIGCKKWNFPRGGPRAVSRHGLPLRWGVARRRHFRPQRFAVADLMQLSTRSGRLGDRSPARLRRSSAAGPRGRELRRVVTHDGDEAAGAWNQDREAPGLFRRLQHEVHALARPLIWIGAMVSPSICRLKGRHARITVDASDIDTAAREDSASNSRARRNSRRSHSVWRDAMNLDPVKATEGGLRGPASSQPAPASAFFCDYRTAAIGTPISAPITSPEITISTRRLSCRPATVSLEATG